MWSKNIGQLTIHTLRDIEAEQEIRISYLASTSEYAERHNFVEGKVQVRMPISIVVQKAMGWASEAIFHEWPKTGPSHWFGPRTGTLL
jgi:hypothetical protein